MPHTAFCSECGTYVWITPEGMCPNGHGRPCLRNLHESGSLPASATVAAVAAVPPVTQAYGATAPAYDSSGYAAGTPTGTTPLDTSSETYGMIPGMGIESGSGIRASQTDVLGKRIGAYIIDLMILQGIQFFVGLALGIVLVLGSGNSVSEGYLNTIGWIAGVMLWLVYFVACEAFLGFTLGKAIFGLRVRRQDGSNISIGQSLGRNLARFIDLLFFALPGLLAINNSEYNQRLGDQWADTYVIRA